MVQSTQDENEEEEEGEDGDVCLADSACRLLLLSLPSIRSNSASSAPPEKKRARLSSPIRDAIIVYRDAMSSPLASKRRGSASASAASVSAEEEVEEEEEEEEEEAGIVCPLSSV
ncbi:uncharacterized [Tachysurus ichikawai]